MAITPIGSKNPQANRSRAAARVAAGLGAIGTTIEKRNARIAQAEQDKLDRDAAAAAAKQAQSNEDRRQTNSETRTGIAAGGLKVEQDREARLAEDAKLDKFLAETQVGASMDGTLALLGIRYGGKIPPDVRESVEAIFKDPTISSRNINLREMWKLVAPEGTSVSAYMERLGQAKDFVFGEVGSGVLELEANQLLAEMGPIPFHPDEPKFGEKGRDEKILEKVRDRFFNETDGVYKDINKEFHAGIASEIFDWISRRDAAEQTQAPPIAGQTSNKPIVPLGEETLQQRGVVRR